MNMPQNIYNKNGGKKQWLSPTKNNKITVKGFLSSNITEVPNSSYATYIYDKSTNVLLSRIGVLFMNDLWFMYVTIRIN